MQVALAHAHLTRRRLRPAGRRARSSTTTSPQFGLADRLRFTGGDFFADPLPQADVLVMGHILHDWDLDEKRMLLAQGLRGAARRAGR